MKSLLFDLKLCAGFPQSVILECSNTYFTSSSSLVINHSNLRAGDWKHGTLYSLTKLAAIKIKYRLSPVQSLLLSRYDCWQQLCLSSKFFLLFPPWKIRFNHILFFSLISEKLNCFRRVPQTSRIM